MIRGSCRTARDGYETEKWPAVFCSVPRVGERVEGKSGRSLKVVRVTHYMIEADLDEAVELKGTMVPRIAVELNR